MAQYDLHNKIEKIVWNNVTTYPYEGDSIDKYGISGGVEDLVNSLLKGYGTYILKNYVISPKGWKNIDTGVISDRQTVIDEFLKSIK